MYRVIVPSHRSNVRDTVLHLEIINPLARKIPSYETWTGIVRIRPARSTELDYQRGYRRDIEFTTVSRRIKSVSRLSNGIDSFSKMEIYKIRYAIYECICLLTISKPTLQIAASFYSFDFISPRLAERNIVTGGALRWEREEGGRRCNGGSMLDRNIVI